MKKIFFLLTAVAFVSCNSNNDAKVESMNTSEDSTGNVTYPYEIGYSSKFEIGDAQQSKMILELWKDFDSGDVSKHKEYFADSIQMLFPDGSSMNNVRDSIIAETNRYRAMYSSVTSRVDAVLPVKSTDKGENWVCVWGKEIHTLNGKTDSTDLQETWRFNKEGKIDFMMQYARSAPKK